MRRSTSAHRVRAASTLAAALFAAGLLQPAAAAPSPGQSPDERPGLLVRLPDGRHLNFRCEGRGSPTVILESGFAATSLAWVRVQPTLARTRRTCAYDRAGYGFSDPGPDPRDGAAIARDLDQGLRAARIAGPFILVGHSAGALYVRLFANLRPREVVGMVLVDPSIEYQDRRYGERFGPAAAHSLEPLRARAERCLQAALAHALPSTDPELSACTPKRTRASTPADAASAQIAEAARPSVWRTQISELDSLWRSTSDEVAAGRPAYGDLPLIVLTAGDAEAVAEPASARGVALRFWRSLHSEIAVRSRLGLERLVTPSSHMMMFDRPEAVTAAVDDVATMAVKKSR